VFELTLKVHQVVSIAHSLCVLCVLLQLLIFLLSTGHIHTLSAQTSAFSALKVGVALA